MSGDFFLVTFKPSQNTGTLNVPKVSACRRIDLMGRNDNDVFEKAVIQ